ncbi:hypothetical protein AArcS_2795 [Natranaeroarchaeum sulfidigenes]|uniref:Uncharacterized protein n=1 Tax=Natranaeroarchaeum sulfidigenes TaxID=2784880 RepID=A0A897MVF1_9EURY|nr:hypothetical protein AArcS_2795 [Natranaeroarchaeum sulfidigenes]
MIITPISPGFHNHQSWQRYTNRKRAPGWRTHCIEIVLTATGERIRYSASARETQQ